MIERKSEVRLKQSNLDFSLKTLHNVYYSSASPRQLPHLYFLFENCSGRKWKPYRMYKRQKTLLFRTVSQNECETELRLSLREVCIERWKICYVNLQCNCFEMEILVMVHSWNKQIFRFCKPILYLISYPIHSMKQNKYFNKSTCDGKLLLPYIFKKVTDKVA